MTALQEVEKLLPALTRAEKAQLAEAVRRDLGDAAVGIEITPGVCGGDPRVANTRIPVWLLEAFRRQGMTEVELLQSYPTLRAEDLVNAWAYVRAHREEIDEQIRDNERESE
jgi:uncharacterized protein (DUF433 family)